MFFRNSRTRSCYTSASVVNKVPIVCSFSICAFPIFFSSPLAQCLFFYIFFIGHSFKSPFLLAVKRRDCLLQRQSRRADGAHVPRSGKIPRQNLNECVTWTPFENTDGRASFHSFAMIFVCKRTGLDQHLPIDVFT